MSRTLAGLRRLGLPAIACLAGAALLLYLVAALNLFDLGSATRLLIIVGLAASWNIVGGLAGQLHLGHAAFFGVGAYAAGWSMLHIAEQPLVGIAVAMAVTAVGSVALLPLFRTEHAFFAIGTLAIVVVVTDLAARYFPGGKSGFDFPAYPAMYEPMMMAALVGGVVATAVITWLMLRSRFGLSLRAIKGDQIAAQLSGTDVFRIKALTFAVSGALGGGFGAIYALDLGYLDPSSAFPIEWSILPLLACLIGGVGTVTGPLVGGLVVWVLDEATGAYLDSAAASLLVEGILLLALARWLPRGVVGALRRTSRPPRRRLAPMMSNRGTAAAQSGVPSR